MRDIEIGNNVRLARIETGLTQEELAEKIRIVASEMFRGLNSFPLLAIPLFVLAGELMNESGITRRIIAFANVIVGGFRAGLAAVAAPNRFDHFAQEFVDLTVGAADELRGIECCLEVERCTGTWLQHRHGRVGSGWSAGIIPEENRDCPIAVSWCVVCGA